MQPANIFLTTDGTIKVGDLGLSREMSDETMQAYSKVGTPLYMSPEVLKGDGYDFKSDIWSIGCLLYEVDIEDLLLSAWPSVYGFIRACCVVPNS